MRIATPVAVVLTGLLLPSLAACGSDNGPSSGGATDASSIQLSDTSLGKVITDANGRTLYLFTKDSGGTSACTGSCESVWPYVEGKPSAGTGTDASLIGTITRSDGDVQATYAGHPLYYYSGDSAAGDVNGEEIEGTWYAVDAHGQQVESGGAESPSPSMTDSGGGGSGY